jgi:hypothetical protein
VGAFPAVVASMRGFNLLGRRGDFFWQRPGGREFDVDGASLAHAAPVATNAPEENTSRPVARVPCGLHQSNAHRLSAYSAPLSFARRVFGSGVTPK